LINDVWRHNFLERQFTKSFIPSEQEDIVQGSPLLRADEMPVPALLFHGDMDLNVNVDHSRDLEKGLRRAKKKVDYFEYKGADHYIQRQRDRIDMLQRMGDFLATHLAEKSSLSSSLSSSPATGASGTRQRPD
jgi:dipeptidyl aminopeptidase/acylaminoacyl peptidase